LLFYASPFRKNHRKQLKTAVLDFYDTADICRAKDNLLEATEPFKSDICLPHVPLRRDGEQRSAKSVDDILTILTFLDENLKLNCLPKYVSVSPDAMPSIRIYDGDLQSIMMAFDKLRNRIWTRLRRHSPPS